MGKRRHVVIHDVIHDVYGDTTKWATDPSAIRTWPCKYSMHQYSILLQILGNWLIACHMESRTFYQIIVFTIPSNSVHR